jgi:hypothetical protein
MKRSKKRTLLMVLLLLTGGAIINVAVAWAFALWEPYQSTNPTDVKSKAPDIFAAHGIQISADDDFYAVQGHGPGLTITSAIIESDQPSRILMLTEAGWPQRSLSGVFEMATAMGSAPVTSFHHAIELSPRIRARNPEMPQLAYVLPLRPKWPGFAVNTIFYAAILWLLFVAPGFARRRIRARRGLCPACAYPIGTNPLCTECGKPIAPLRVPGA